MGAPSPAARPAEPAPAAQPLLADCRAAFAGLDAISTAPLICADTVGTAHAEKAMTFTGWTRTMRCSSSSDSAGGSPN
jgi:hypothetical protein